MITFDKLIKNFDNFDKNGGKLIQKEIFQLFEPILYQVILTTRMDSGTGRASLGLPFVREILPSQRIIDAIEMDIEVNRDAYHFWANQFGIKDPYQDYLGTVKKLIDGKKVVVNVISYDQGVINQNNGEKPSLIHKRPRPERHNYHIKEIVTVVNNVELENFNGGGRFLPDIAQDIRENIKKLYKRVEELLFT